GVAVDSGTMGSGVCMYRILPGDPQLSDSI
ncbi:MAG: hypothetical protein ACI9EZ_001187, partial [Halobacteriales archaeon]